MYRMHTISQFEDILHEKKIKQQNMYIKFYHGYEIGYYLKKRGGGRLSR